MSQKRILAIEDDPIAAESLKMHIEEMGYILIDVVDEINDFTRMVRAALPDILILDIDLGDALNGIDLARKLSKEFDIPFIFVTSMTDQSTVEDAVEAAPAAFLNKPYTKASLKAAIELATSRHIQISNSNRSDDQITSLFIKDGSKLIKIPIEDLCYVEVLNKQCKLQFKDDSNLITAKLSDLSQQLQGEKFVQVHRSFLVNLEMVTEIDAHYKNLSIDDHHIPIGRSYKEILMTKLLKIG